MALMAKADDRVAVLRHVCELFAQGSPQLQKSLCAEFDDIMTRLLSHVSPAGLAEFAPLGFAHRETLPRFAASLADVGCDAGTVETVQRPVSSGIAERRQRPRRANVDPDHPGERARRADVDTLVGLAASATVCDAVANVVVARGDRRAIDALVRNPAAKLARSSLTTLAELAASDLMIKLALISRTDLPEPIVNRLLPFLDDPAKGAVLLSGAPFTSETARTVLADAHRELAFSYRGGTALLGVDSFLSMVADASISVDEAILALTQDLRIAELADFLARSSGVAFVTALNAVAGRLDHAVVPLVKVANGGPASVAAMMEMRRQLGYRTGRETLSACSIFVGYTLAQATAVLRAMDLVAKREAEQVEATPVMDAELEQTVFPEALAA
jgi:hypothetical protein